MDKQSVITCPYCGSELMPQGPKYYCDFCMMILGGHQVQRDHQRLSVRVRDFALDAYLEKTTPELMRLSTFELLSLLKYARTERTHIYNYMNIFYKARKHGELDDYRETEEETGVNYGRITRKMFVLENLIRQRLGYVPRRITDAYLARYLEEMKRDKNKPMTIRQERQADLKDREPVFKGTTDSLK
ncbi:hypothetical protein LCL90_23085 [Bacillus infantis]|uniref:hypothetical protein n=1 Tax=Bacillus infantis TaxID=324767 RepID=UPI001CD32AB9|nr:hypothetical protein [Bacillus infantis]MCA1037520.1 hypothetical protein [Bacillus infantis]HER2025581.1 hypothetical protein [Streptococcus pyogenes]